MRKRSVLTFSQNDVYVSRKLKEVPLKSGRALNPLALISFLVIRARFLPFQMERREAGLVNTWKVLSVAEFN